MSYRTVAIALTVYGIETRKNKTQRLRIVFCVAIALTVYGIETCMNHTPIVVATIAVLQ